MRWIVKFALPLALSLGEEEQDFKLPSPAGEGLRMRGIHASRLKLVVISLLPTAFCLLLQPFAFHK
jgi:hypothetical protein